jgi:hypothetical protein
MLPPEPHPDREFEGLSTLKLLLNRYNFSDRNEVSGI